MNPYQERILKHAREPFGVGVLQDPAIKLDGYNHLCGDKITLYVQFHEGNVLQLAFESEGCALCRASASVMVHEMMGLPRAIAPVRAQSVLDHLQQGQAMPSPPWSEDVAALADMQRFPSRLRCVTLAWETFVAVFAPHQSVIP